MLLQIMIQRGQLFAGGIVAAGAGFVSIPADFRTGRGFCCVLLQIMVQCGQLLIGGGIVTTGAGFVSVPADFRTAGGFCIVMHQIVIIWVFFAVFRAAFFAGFAFGAGGRFGTAGMYL